MNSIVPFNHAFISHKQFTLTFTPEVNLGGFIIFGLDIKIVVVVQQFA